jgi:4-hydroxy-3-polyprenylbenzoate decarboxylase
MRIVRLAKLSIAGAGRECGLRPLESAMKRIVVGMTGATGAPLAVRVLEFLHDLDVEVHLIVSQWARATLLQECGISAKDLKLYASVVHDDCDQGASISGGSFHTDGMIVVPCSMKTLAAIRCGYANNLIARAADVTIKERRRLVLVARETPLSPIHLENLLELSRIGQPSSPQRSPSTIDQRPSRRCSTTWRSVSSTSSASSTLQLAAGKG